MTEHLWRRGLLLAVIICCTSRKADSGSSFDLQGTSLRQVLHLKRDETGKGINERILTEREGWSTARIMETPTAKDTRKLSAKTKEGFNCRRTCVSETLKRIGSPNLRLVGGGMDWLDMRLNHAFESAVRPKGGDNRAGNTDEMLGATEVDSPAEREGRAPFSAHPTQGPGSEPRESTEAKPWFADRLDNAFLSEVESSLTPSNSQHAAPGPSPVACEGENSAPGVPLAGHDESPTAETSTSGTQTTTPTDQMSRCSDPEEGDTTKSCQETAFGFDSRHHSHENAGGDESSRRGRDGGAWGSAGEAAGDGQRGGWPRALPSGRAGSQRYLSMLSSEAGAGGAPEVFQTAMSPAAAREDPPAADRWFRHMLGNYPASADLHAMYADFLVLVGGNARAAAAMYRRALEIASEHVPSTCGVAMLIFRERRWSVGGERGRRRGSVEAYWGELEALSERAKQHRRHQALAQLVHGLWLELKGDSLGAEKELRSFLAASTEVEVEAVSYKTARDWLAGWERGRYRAEAWCKLGQLEERHGNAAAAEAAYRSAQAADPGVADGFRLLAALMSRGAGAGREKREGTGEGQEGDGEGVGSDEERERERERGVEALLEKAIAADEGDPDALSDYGQFLHDVRGDFYEAEKYYRRALAQCGQHKATLSRYARLLERELGDASAAIGMCQRALQVEEDVETLSRYGRLLYDEAKDYDGAESVYKKVLEMDLACVEVMHDYGRLLEEVRGDKAAAERMYRRALHVDERHVPTLTNLGLLLEEHRGDVAGAEAMYQRALAADPRDVGTLYNYALLLQTAHSDLDGAEALLKRLLAVEPCDGDALHVYGSLLLDHRDDSAGAEGMLQRALQQKPGDVGVLCDLGRMLQGAGRNLEAEERFEAALREAPQSEAALRGYAALLHDELHNVVRAEELYKQILAGTPSSTTKASVLCNYARLLYEQGRIEAAEGLFRQAIDYGVMDHRAMRAYARLLDETRGDFGAARQFYHKLLVSDPSKTAEDLLGVASLRRVAGDTDGAQRLLSLLLDTPECAPTHAEAAWALGGVLQDRGQLELATGMYRRALEQNPARADQAFQVAKEWEGRGQLLAARALYGLVLKADAEHGNAAWRLALGLEGAAEEEMVSGDEEFGKEDVVSLLLCALQSNLSMVEEVHAFGAAREARGDAAGSWQVLEAIVNQTHGTHFPSVKRACQVLHRGLRDYDRAESMYARAVETGVFDDELLLGYGQLLEMVRGNAAAAQMCYRRAETCNPTNVAVLLHLARSLHRSGRALPLARALYERAVVLCSDRAVLARSRRRSAGLAVEAEVHVALLTGYADLLREQQAAFNTVEDLYMAVLQHDPEHEQALLGEMCLLLDAGRDEDLAALIMQKLVARRCPHARPWFEYGKRCLRGARRWPVGREENVAMLMTLEAGLGACAAVWEQVLRMDLWGQRSDEGAALELPSESVQDGTPVSLTAADAGKTDSDSTLTIDGGTAMDWGCPPSQRASEVLGEVEDSSFSGGVWHPGALHSGRGEEAETRRAGSAAGEGRAAMGDEAEGSTAPASDTMRDSSQERGPRAWQWDFNVSFGSSPMPSSPRSRQEEREEEGAHLGALSAPKPAAEAGRSMPADEGSSEAGGLRREEGGEWEERRSESLGREVAGHCVGVGDAAGAAPGADAGATPAAKDSSAQHTPQTPQTPEGQVGAARDEWDTFVNAHKTRSLQHLPEFSTPRSSWTHPRSSPVAACALPRSRCSDSLECTPNCTKPVNAFAVLRAEEAEERSARRAWVTSTSPSLPNQREARAHATLQPASSLGPDTLPCEDADGSHPAASPAPLQAGAALRLSAAGVNTALLTSPSDSSSASPNDMARLAALLSDLPASTRPSPIRSRHITPWRGAGSRPALPKARARSPIRVRTIQNGGVDRFRKPRVGVAGPSPYHAWGGATPLSRERKLEMLVQHVRMEDEDEESSEASRGGRASSSQSREGRSSQDERSMASERHGGYGNVSKAEEEHEASGSRMREDSANESERLQPEEASRPWFGEGTPRASWLAEEERGEHGDEKATALQWKRLGLEKRRDREARRQQREDRVDWEEEGMLEVLFDYEAADDVEEEAPGSERDAGGRAPGVESVGGDSDSLSAAAASVGAEESMQTPERAALSEGSTREHAGEGLGSGVRGKRTPGWKVVGEDKRMRRERGRAQAGATVEAALEGLKTLLSSPSSPQQRGSPLQAGGWQEVVVASAAWRGVARSTPRLRRAGPGNPAAVPSAINAPPQPLLLGSSIAPPLPYTLNLPQAPAHDPAPVWERTPGAQAESTMSERADAPRLLSEVADSDASMSSATRPRSRSRAAAPPSPLADLPSDLEDGDDHEAAGTVFPGGDAGSAQQAQAVVGLGTVVWVASVQGAAAALTHVTVGGSHREALHGSEDGEVVEGTSAEAERSWLGGMEGSLAGSPGPSERLSQVADPSEMCQEQALVGEAAWSEVVSAAEMEVEVEGCGSEAEAVESEQLEEAGSASGVRAEEPESWCTRAEDEASPSRAGDEEMDQSGSGYGLEFRSEQADVKPWLSDSGEDGDGLGAEGQVEATADAGADAGGDSEASEAAVAEERCEEAQKQWRNLRRAALEGGPGGVAGEEGRALAATAAGGLAKVHLNLKARGAGPAKPWDERVFSAVRGIALRREMSRADKHKVTGMDGKAVGIRSGECFLARAAGAPGWLRVTDGRYAKDGELLYVPLSTVAGEELVVEVSSLVDDDGPKSGEEIQGPRRRGGPGGAAGRTGSEGTENGEERRNYVQLMHM